MSNTSELKFRKGALLSATAFNRVTFAKIESEYGFMTDGSSARLSETAHRRYSFADLARAQLLAWLTANFQMNTRTAIGLLNACFDEIGRAVADAKASAALAGSHYASGGPWIVIRDVRDAAIGSQDRDLNVRGPFWFAWSRAQMAQAVDAGLFGITIDFAGVVQRAAAAEARISHIQED